MANTTYYGSLGAAQALNYTVTVPLSGGSSISGARIDSVVAAAFMSTNAYGTTYQVRARLLNSVGATLAEVTRYDIKFDSGNYTGATWYFDFGTSVDVNSIASISYFGLNEASKIFVKSTQSVAVNYTPITVCSAPTSASVAPSLCENDPTLSASGASGGSANAITGYEIQYAESANGTSYGAWTVLKTVSTTGASLSTTVTLPSVRAYSRKYRLRTRGAAGSSYYSGWKETNAIKRNSLPTAPTSFTASPEVYVSGAIALTYSGAADPDGNLSTHNIQYATKSGVEAWSAWANLTNGITAHTPTLSPGQSIKYRVRAVDALGAVSSYKESNTCVKNTAPSKPTVNYPKSSKTIHNNRPRLLVTLGADPEGHTQKIIASGYIPSRADGLTSGAKIILRKAAGANPGTINYSVKSADQYNEESAAATGSLTYSAPSYTDANLTASTTRIKAAHMNELRGMIADIQKYYGFDENLVDNSEFDTSTGWTANQNVTLQTVAFGEDKALRATCNQTTSTPGLITTQNVNRNDYLLGVSHTIQMRVKSATESDVKLRVSLFGNSSVSFTALSADWSTVTISTKVTALTQPWLLIYFSSPSVGAAFDISWIKITKGSSPFVDGEMIWAEAITAGFTKSRNWPAHIAEMRNAINDVISLINGWDAASSTNRITVPSWLAVGSKPSAAVMEQIRSIIMQL